MESEGPVIMNTFLKSVVVLWVSAVALTAYGFKELQPTANERRIARAVGQHIPRAHYTRTPIDDEFSKKLFEEYFDALDPNKYFFFKKDIEQFDIYRTRLDDDIAQGDIRFAFQVFSLFQKRMAERMEWVKKRVEQPFDYTIDEFFELDRKDAEWTDSEKKYNELWRKRIKNSLLLYQMITDAMTEKKNGDDLTEEEKKELRDEELFPHKSPKERLLKYFDLLVKRYEEFDNEDILELFLSTLTRIYDPHSSYMSPKTMEDFNISMRLSLQGIGATLQSDMGFTKVTKLMPGGPAEKSNKIKEGDRIIAVAQEGEDFVDIIDMPLNKVVKLIRGKKGTKVRLTILDGEKGWNSKPKVVEIVRDKVQIKESEAQGEVKEILYSSLNPELRKIFSAKKNAEDDKTADKDKKNADEKQKLDQKLRIGIITLPSFYADFEAVQKGDPNAKTLTTDVLNILADMKQKGIDGLVMDLRSNGGGSLSEAIRLTGLFIPKGPVVQIGYGPGVDPKVQSDDDGVVFYRGPLVVMTNKMSASASEIFAGAIQDYKRGVVVGDKKTHGKGTVQTIFDLDRLFRLPSLFKLPAAGTLKFTVQKFYRITGASTQKKGVEADIVFPSFTDHMEMGEELLPHVLKWDEVKRAEFSSYDQSKLHIPQLRKRSTMRRANNDKFKLLLEEINEYASKVKDKKVSLNKQKREDERKNDDKIFERRRSLLMPEADPADKKSTDDDKERDVYLDETLMIMTDMIMLDKAIIPEADKLQSENKVEVK